MYIKKSLKLKTSRTSTIKERWRKRHCIIGQLESLLSVKTKVKKNEGLMLTNEHYVYPVNQWFGRPRKLSEVAR